jgi:hypothetical protein
MAAVLPPLSAREPSRSNVDDMSIADMEKALAGNPRRRVVKDGDAPQTARAILQVNRELIEEKKQRKAIQRNNSREEFDRLLEANQRVIEDQRSQAITRRSAQREMAHYYKSKICEKEEKKANAYNEKLASASSNLYWPFREGETVSKETRNDVGLLALISELRRAAAPHRQHRWSRRIETEREAKAKVLHEEMQGFMAQQRQANPPRQEFDPLVAHNTVKAGYSLQYPVSPRDGLPALGSPADAKTWDPAKESHISGHPRFLRKDNLNGRRKNQETLAAKTLEQRVLQTKQELEARASALRAEQQEWEEGMLVNDAIKYDRDKAKAIERRRNKDYLLSQMEEKKTVRKQEHDSEMGKYVGYWGPEEKPLQDVSVRRDHCSDLIKQMEVDQKRKTMERNTAVREEKKLLKNAMTELVRDRMRDRRKAQEEKSVLTSTWGNQEKIIQAKRDLHVT